jgi:predicted nucleotidyltransferase
MASITKTLLGLTALAFQCERMGNILNQDFKEFILCLNSASVEYMLVGGYAVIYHGYNRTTGDLDVWVNPTKENYLKLTKAFNAFGMGVFDMTMEKFLAEAHYDVFTFGRPPVCIEILTAVKGLVFNESYAISAMRDFDGLNVQMIDIRDLLIAKKSANRAKDHDDIEHLKQ